MIQLSSAGFRKLLINSKNGTIKRNYSFFSSKGNGGKYFTGNNKPVDPKSPKSTSVSSEVSSSDNSISAEKVQIQSTESQLRPLLPHPSLTPRDLQIHQLLAIHRPLLSLHSPEPFHSPSLPDNASPFHLFTKQFVSS